MHKHVFVTKRAQKSLHQQERSELMHTPLSVIDEETVNYDSKRIMYTYMHVGGVAWFVYEVTIHRS